MKMSYKKYIKQIYVLFLLVSSVLAKKPTEIRAQCILGSPGCWHRFLQLNKHLRKCGLRLADKYPDVILCNKFIPELIDQDVPIIILERKASGSLWSSTRKSLKYNQVKAVFKNRTLKHKELYNVPNPRHINAFHYKIINDYANITTLKNVELLGPDELNKIHCIVWHLEYSPFSERAEILKDIVIDYKAKRPIDVFFAGRVDLPSQTNKKKWYSWHRRRCIDELQKVTYVPCLPDFSDLKEKVMKIVANYEKYTPMRKRAKRLLVDSWDLKKLAFDFAQAVKKVLGYEDDK